MVLSDITAALLGCLQLAKCPFFYKGIQAIEDHAFGLETTVDVAFIVLKWKLAYLYQA